jgi:hypothetical protein
MHRNISYINTCKLKKNRERRKILFAHLSKYNMLKLKSYNAHTKSLFRPVQWYDLSEFVIRRFEDTKWVIRNRNSENDKQSNAITRHRVRLVRVQYMCRFVIFYQWLTIFTHTIRLKYQALKTFYWNDGGGHRLSLIELIL